MQKLVSFGSSLSQAALLFFLLGTLCTVRADDGLEMLNVTIGTPTRLSDLVYQNTSALLISRTGVLAAVYPKPNTGPHFYRVSTDGGHTWGPEMNGPPEHGGGQCSGTLRDGGVIIAAKDAQRSTDYTRAEGWKGSSKDPKGLQKDWFDIVYTRFADDFLSWQIETVRIHQPKGVPFFRGEGGLGFTKGKMVQLPNGDLLSPMAGAWEGDGVARSWVVRSTDQGRTFEYHGTIDYSPQDPDPQLPGHYVGAHEPSIAMLSDGRMLAVVRRQYAHYPGEYKPLTVSWSDDQGRTWTKAVATQPNLMNISPTLAASWTTASSRCSTAGPASTSRSVWTTDVPGGTASAFRICPSRPSPASST